VSEYLLARSRLIERIIQFVLQNLSAKSNLNKAVLQKFLQHYYTRLSLEDLERRALTDLFGAAMSHWQFIQEWHAVENKIRIYNPNQEEYGWQSAYTVIELLTHKRAFVIDSLRLMLLKAGYAIHLFVPFSGMQVQRNAQHALTALEFVEDESIANREISVYIEINKQENPAVLQELQQNIQALFLEIDLVVNDWENMRNQCGRLVNFLEQHSNAADVVELVAFLRWLLAGNFTFLGFAAYQAQKGCIGSFGLLRQSYKQQLIQPILQNSLQMTDSFFIGKTAAISNIHRPGYEDVFGVKFFINGVLQEEWCFLGLYTAATYNSSPQQIPLLRNKILKAVELAELRANSQTGKALINILETLPRDDLLHASIVELHDLAVGILYLQERQKVRLFLRKDMLSNYFSCLVFLPRDHFNFFLRQKIQDILLQQLQGVTADFNIYFSESILARLHFLIRVPASIMATLEVSLQDLENKISDVAHTWDDDLLEELYLAFGEHQGYALSKIYSDGFPVSYQEHFSARSAIVDIKHIETVVQQQQQHGINMNMYKHIEDAEDGFRFKLYNISKAVMLSEVVPVLENMGLKIMRERPYIIKRKAEQYTEVWVNEYKIIQMSKQSVTIDQVKQLFQNAFAAIWHGFAENDRFNRLVLRAQLTWREVMVIRAYFKYLWQIGLNFSQATVEDTLYNNPDFAKQMIIFFLNKFSPHIANQDRLNIEALTACLEQVKNLNEDRILRKFLYIVMATVRTNYFQVDAASNFRAHLSFKFVCAQIPDLPKPCPLYEIFVYSPRVEGIHLRAGKVARGGVRWSERHDDYRTEVLGLMKAQQVKNSVIVPVGAKGGFVVKKGDNMSNHEYQQEGIECYKIFVAGLLDVTVDNKYNVIYDENDPYLVVAPDKGTSSFSDIANHISAQYQFWLGDAFASAGITGYDHKKMGITTRGAWESLKMHFQRLRLDPHQHKFTAIGIGDLSGDVFGNFSIMSNCMQLVAAFNHRHIFVDPNPDPVMSFQERQRIFRLPSSSWTDYNPQLISNGGGVFDRSNKSIKISAVVQKMFNIARSEITPNELVKAILMAPVDLLWNGGIGTFVKAQQESHQNVGDRANDAVRIDGAQLCCKVVVEGGNLGFTQLGRIEYAKRGGLINTDALDNSGGVNCSDNEVNIKILFANIVAAGDMTLKQRNQLLSAMQDEVAELVLLNNRKQNKAITFAELQAFENLEMHHRIMHILERVAGLDRAIEFLPSHEDIMQRKALKQGLTRPELAVLLAYAKIAIKKTLLENITLLEDGYIAEQMVTMFPKLMQQQFLPQIMQHRLRHELIATQIGNQIVDEMGLDFVFRLQDEAGASVGQVVAAYMIVRELFRAQQVRAALDAMAMQIELKLQVEAWQELTRLLRRATRWLLRNRKNNLNIRDNIQYFQAAIVELMQNLPHLLDSATLQQYQKVLHAYTATQFSPALAQYMSSIPYLFSALDIAATAMQQQLPVLALGKTYFALGHRLDLWWLRELIKKQAINDSWEASVRGSFRDDIDRYQSQLAVCVMQSKLEPHTWLQHKGALLGRWEYVLQELKQATPSFTMFAVALRELADFIAISL
jgi:glutamate dehydrogenase